jgi:hypothetical protein
VSLDGQVFRNTVFNLSLSGLFLLGLHYVYPVLLGPTSFDFDTHRHKYSLLPALIRGVEVDPVARIIEGSTFSLLGWNLIFIGILLFFLLRRGGAQKPQRNLLIVSTAAVMILLSGLIRINLFSLWERTVAERCILPAIFLGFLVSKPFPLLPYLSFGLFGALLGFALAAGMTPRRVRQIFFSIGAVFLLFGVMGFVTLPPMIGRVDQAWFFKVQVELGLFLIVVVLALTLSHFRSRVTEMKRTGKISILETFGTSSLTIFLLQTPISELLAVGLSAGLPGWDQEIWPMFMFGGANLFLWITAIRMIPNRKRLWPAESLWAGYYRLLGRVSTLNASGQSFYDRAETGRL